MGAKSPWFTQFSSITPIFVSVSGETSINDGDMYHKLQVQIFFSCSA